MKKILIVDDDPNIRELIAVFLGNEGMACIEAEDGKQAMQILEEDTIALVVLDIMMPEMDGWTFCQNVRALYTQLPILMVTAKGETMQKVKGFTLGADDYLVKPFEPIELVMRVKALLKRYQVNISQTVTVGRLTLDQKNYLVQTPTDQFSIPHKEFDLLYTLASAAGRTLTRDDLIEQVWGYDYSGDERTVDVHIKRLRERFNENQFNFTIRTVRGLGYRLEESQ
ncbi:MAG: response regulator transcription factor [Sporolactobacillus sp.]